MSTDTRRYPSLNDFLTANELTVDGQIDDGWGADVLVKGYELEATILFADITNFSGRTADMSPVETLVYVNTFFAWITAEALRSSSGIVDKYIGDEVMVVFSKAFGSEDPFEDAVRAARRICEHDVLDYGPHIGIASGPVVVGHVGTPLMQNCSVFGPPVAMAARCAGIKPKLDGERFASHCITFPSRDWNDRVLATVLEEEQAVPDSGSLFEKWSLLDSFPASMKNLGDVEVRQLVDEGFLRINQGWSAESRAREAVALLERHNRYWPNGRERKP